MHLYVCLVFSVYFHMFMSILYVYSHFVLFIYILMLSFENCITLNLKPIYCMQKVHTLCIHRSRDRHALEIVGKMFRIFQHLPRTPLGIPSGRGV